LETAATIVQNAPPGTKRLSRVCAGRLCVFVGATSSRPALYSPLGSNCNRFTERSHSVPHDIGHVSECGRQFLVRFPRRRQGNRTQTANMTISVSTHTADVMKLNSRRSIRTCISSEQSSWPSP
jgi:hypothetical protein